MPPEPARCESQLKAVETGVANVKKWPLTALDAAGRVRTERLSASTASSSSTVIAGNTTRVVSGPTIVAAVIRSRIPRSVRYRLKAVE
jgi:hypothetical protein